MLAYTFQASAYAVAHPVIPGFQHHHTPGFDKPKPAELVGDFVTACYAKVVLIAVEVPILKEAHSNGEPAIQDLGNIRAGWNDNFNGIVLTFVRVVTI